MNILIVDDEKSITRALNRAFSRTGHVVTTANNGSSSISLLSESSYDLLLIDLIMPDLTGDQVIAWAIDQHIQLKIVLMTAYQDQKIDEISNSKKVSAVFRKPFNDVFALVKEIEAIA